MWHIPEYIDVSSVDTEWTPPNDTPYIYHFLSQHQHTDSTRLPVGSSGVTYTMPGATQIQIVYDKPVKALAVMSRWSVPDNIDSASVDFTWHPNAFDPPYIYHFGSKFQQSTGLTYTVPGATEIKFVKPFDVRVTSAPIFYMDFLNPGSKEQFEALKKHYPNIKSTRYVSDHLNVLKRIMNLADSKFVWVISSICDYREFDFSWHPSIWQEEMIHCFSNSATANSSELRGDTFYINVESFKSQMIELAMLDWFNVINYVVDQKVERWPVPAVHYEGDNLIEAIKNHTFITPYAMFTNDPALTEIHMHTNCLWTEKDRVIRDLSADKSTSLIPRDIKKYLKTQVYDYPYIDTNYKRNVRYTEDLDIIYISNGEPDEERWYDNTVYQSNRSVKWIRGVNGRTAAYQAAARASKTDWFFAVFAKLEVLGGRFDWHWQPDYWQGPKHYIFNARNPLNGLEYGHQGMIAYNKRLVLENNTPGIDFTLSQPHESVPILSGTAHFNQTPWMTWRTAFREVLKLKHFSVVQPSVETDYRLKVWTTKASGDNAGWCLQGAKDALEYYSEVGGNYSELLKSFEWAWLKQYYDAKY